MDLCTTDLCTIRSWSFCFMNHGHLVPFRPSPPLAQRCHRLPFRPIHHPSPLGPPAVVLPTVQLCGLKHQSTHTKTITRQRTRTCPSMRGMLREGMIRMLRQRVSCGKSVPLLVAQVAFPDSLLTTDTDRPGGANALRWRLRRKSNSCVLILAVPSKTRHCRRV